MRNLRCVKVFYKQLNKDLTLDKKIKLDNFTDWFDHDISGVRIIDRGTLVSTTADANNPAAEAKKEQHVDIDLDKGTRLFHNGDTGWRICEKQKKSVGAKKEDLTKKIDYNVAGQPKTLTTKQGTFTEIIELEYHPWNWLHQYHLTKDNTKQTYFYHYDLDLRLDEQGRIETKLKTKKPKPTSVYEMYFSQFLPDGQPQCQDTYWPTKVGATAKVNVTLDYKGFESWMLIRSQGRGCSFAQGSWTRDKKMHVVTVTYDASGNAQTVFGELSGKDVLRWLQTNPDGRVVVKQIGGKFEYFIYDVRWQRNPVIGWVGDLPSDPTSGEKPTKVNFDPLYHELSQNWPPNAPAQIATAPQKPTPPSDSESALALTSPEPQQTFAEVAQRLYQDDNHEYMMAQPNGSSPGDNVLPGQLMAVPQQIMDRDDPHAPFAPYNPGAIIGNIYPYTPIPRPIIHENLWLEMGIETLAFFVAVVIMHFEPELAAALVKGLAMLDVAISNVAADTIAYAALTAASDAADQLIMIGAGAQHGFSVKEWGQRTEMGAITGAIAGGLVTAEGGSVSDIGGPSAPGANDAFINNQFARSLVNNTLLNVGGQLALAALDRKRKLSWQDLVATLSQTVVEGGVDSILGVNAEDRDELTLTNFISTMLKSEVDNALSALIYRQHFNPWVAAAQGMGVFAGQVAGHLHDKQAEDQKRAQQKKKNVMTVGSGTLAQAAPDDTLYFAMGTDALGGNPDFNIDAPTLSDYDDGMSMEPNESEMENYGYGDVRRSGCRFWGQPAAKKAHTAPIPRQYARKAAVNGRLGVNAHAHTHMAGMTSSETTVHEVDGGYELMKYSPPHYDPSKPSVNEDVHESFWEKTKDFGEDFVHYIGTPLMAESGIGPAIGVVADIYKVGRSALGVMGFFARRGGAKNTRLISSIERVPSNVANKPFINEDAIAQGWNPPYPKYITIRRVTGSKNLDFVRVHTDRTKPAGVFLVREKVLARMNYDPVKIQQYLGIPDVPIYITDVNVPPGANLLVGRIGPQPNFGLMDESGFQYQLENIAPRSNFSNTRPLSSLVDENTVSSQLGRGWK